MCTAFHMSVQNQSKASLPHKKTLILVTHALKLFRRSTCSQTGVTFNAHHVTLLQSERGSKEKRRYEIGVHL